VPYQYASLWEHPSFPRRDPPPPATAAERVPKELKNRLKKSHGALALLEALEREVREFLLAPSEEDGMVGYESSIAAESEDSEEDEIVFVSRRERGEGVVVRGEETKVLFQSKVEEDGASFGFVSPRKERKGWANGMGAGGGWCIVLPDTTGCRAGALLRGIHR